MSYSDLATEIWPGNENKFSANDVYVGSCWNAICGGRHGLDPIEWIRKIRKGFIEKDRDSKQEGEQELSEKRDDTLNYGRAIRVLRAARGWDQTRLAKEVGVDKSTVSLWESEDRKPSNRKFERLVNVLGVHATTLIALSMSKEDLGETTEVCSLSRPLGTIVLLDIIGDNKGA